MNKLLISLANTADTWPGGDLATPPVADQVTRSPAHNPSRLATALVGLAGTLLLISSFAINPSPPPGATLAEIVDFGRQHSGTILLGVWMQGLGSVLSVLFAVGLVQLTGRGHGLAGWLTVLSGAGIIALSLMESAMYFADLDVGLSGSDTGLATTIVLGHAIQHLYLVVPALLLPVGWLVLRSRLLPTLMAYAALTIGVVLQVLGLAGLLWPVQSIVDGVLIVQGLWFVAASLLLAWQSRTSFRGAPRGTA
jgi:hypothetical protein